jgi:nucleoside-diphosphate-sugar epimerase
MEVLITGGTGFIGSRLAMRQLEDGQRVRILGQENTPAERENRKSLEERGAEVILGSVTDRNLMLEMAKGVDVVFHLAAAQHEMNVPDRTFREVNVTGTQNMLEASLQAGIQRFVHGSTIGVYGPLQGEIREESACQPDNIYGVTKHEGETLALSYRDRLSIVVVRISETYGPGDRRLLKLFRAINKGTFFVIGSGNNLHHPIYISDLVEGLTAAASKPEADGQVFVLSGKDAVTTREMVEVIAGHLGRMVPRVRVPLAPMLLAASVMEAVLRPAGIQPPLHRRRLDFFRKGFTFSQTKAANLLGFAPGVSFEQGALETAQWYKSMGYLS